MDGRFVTQERPARGDSQFFASRLRPAGRARRQRASSRRHRVVHPGALGSTFFGARVEIENKRRFTISHLDTRGRRWSPAAAGDGDAARLDQARASFPRLRRRWVQLPEPRRGGVFPDALPRGPHVRAARRVQRPRPDLLHRRDRRASDERHGREAVAGLRGGSERHRAGADRGRRERVRHVPGRQPLPPGRRRYGFRRRRGADDEDARTNTEKRKGVETREELEENDVVALHTGDFRAARCVREDPKLHALIRDHGPIGELYLDTTYCDPRWRFPTGSARARRWRRSRGRSCVGNRERCSWSARTPSARSVR